MLTEEQQPNNSTLQSTSPKENISSEPAIGNRRGRKAKGKINQNVTSDDQMLQPEVPQRPTRTTRHTANGNMTRVKNFHDNNIAIYFLNRK